MMSNMERCGLVLKMREHSIVNTTDIGVQFQCHSLIHPK